MSAWTIAVVILVVAIVLPTLVVATENLRTRKRHGELAGRVGTQQSHGVLERLVDRLAALEDDVDDLQKAVHDLKEEADSLRRDISGRPRPER